MKKLFLAVLVLSGLVNQVFAEKQKLWNDRIFEINTNIPVNVANNTLGFKDIFTETIVLDLTQIADEMDENGLNFTVNARPSIGIKLEIPSGLHFGLRTGVDLYSSISIDKSLFDFLGYGNELNENISVGFNGYSDAFVYLSADLGWDFDKFKIVLSPSVYTALVHLSTEGSSLSVTNTPDGKISCLLTGNLNLYTMMVIEDTLFNDIKAGNCDALFDLLQNSASEIWEGTGFDVQVSFSYEMYRYFTVTGIVKVPVIPARMTYMRPITGTVEYETSLVEVAQGEFTEPSYSYSIDEIQRVLYKINRPMKINVNGNFHPWNGVMDYTVGLGLGFDHPFAAKASERGVYVDYYLGARVGLLNMINLYLSTERTDRVFIHKAQIGLNFRILELDVGVASESTRLKNSFEAGGIGAFLNCSVGF